MVVVYIIFFVCGVLFVFVVFCVFLPCVDCLVMLVNAGSSVIAFIRRVPNAKQGINGKFN